MKLFAHHDQLGNIHGFFSVEARDGASAIVVPPPGLFVAEIETEGLGLKYDASDTKRLDELAKSHVITTPFPRQTLTKRKKTRG